jgi:hypothetical protein
MSALHTPSERWLQIFLLARLCWDPSRNFNSKKSKSMISSIMSRLNGQALMG